MAKKTKKNTTWYSVTIRRKMGSTEDAQTWEEMLPNELFVRKYRFDGHEYALNKGEIQTYKVFWYPKTFKTAIELFTKIHGLRNTILLEGCYVGFNFTEDEE
jgi:hypothetical protein